RSREPRGLVSVEQMDRSAHAGDAAKGSLNSIATFISELHCPYCGSDLELRSAPGPRGPESGYGIIECGCYKYPLVDGIVILRQMSGPADHDDSASLLIEKGDLGRALEVALSRDSIAPTLR